MRYDAFEYLYPPRPEKAVASGVLPFYEQMGWVGQIKMDGTCNVIAVNPERNRIVAMNRHNAEHKAWVPTVNSTEPFLSLPGSGWYVFVAELMHSKVPGIRDINYVNDILVANGEYLVGENYLNRYSLIRTLFPNGTDMGTHFEVHKNLWIAKIYRSDFKNIFAGLNKPEQEGIVLKDTKAKLVICSREGSNVHWSAKCRRPTKLKGY